MSELSRDETRELLVGTWTAVALVVDVLIKQDALCREELVVMLAEAEAAAPRDRRRTAFAGLRFLIERGFGEAGP